MSLCHLWLSEWFITDTICLDKTDFSYYISNSKQTACRSSTLKNNLNINDMNYLVSQKRLTLQFAFNFLQFNAIAFSNDFVLGINKSVYVWEYPAWHIKPWNHRLPGKSLLVISAIDMWDIEHIGHMQLAAQPPAQYPMQVSSHWWMAWIRTHQLLHIILDDLLLGFICLLTLVFGKRSNRLEDYNACTYIAIAIIVSVMWISCFRHPQQLWCGLTVIYLRVINLSYLISTHELMTVYWS